MKNRTPTSAELASLTRCAAARGITVDRATTEATDSTRCPKCNVEHEDCACASAHPCYGGCGRRTTPFESVAPGYCAICAARSLPLEE